MNDETALEPISLARRALAEATTLPEMKDVRATAAALQKYARARGLGIEAENPCAEIVLRAERKMGAVLAGMGLKAGGPPGNKHRLGVVSDEHALTRPGSSVIGTLGLTTRQSWQWQELARIPDENWDALVADAYANGERLSRADFIRAYFGPTRKEDPLRADEDEWAEGWEKMVAGSALLGAALDGGWPLQSDRTLRGWGEVNDQITAVGRNLLLFQKRVAAHMAAPVPHDD